MPVPNLASRVVCGQFYWQFQNFMRARAERAKAARTRTVKACWPLSFVRTVFVCAVILAMCSSSDSHTGSGQSDNPGVHRQKNDTTSPIQHSVAALHQCINADVGDRHQTFEDGPRSARKTKQVRHNPTEQTKTDRYRCRLCVCDPRRIPTYLW